MPLARAHRATGAASSLPRWHVPVTTMLAPAHGIPSSPPAKGAQHVTRSANSREGERRGCTSKARRLRPRPDARRETATFETAHLRDLLLRRESVLLAARVTADLWHDAGAGFVEFSWERIDLPVESVAPDERRGRRDVAGVPVGRPCLTPPCSRLHEAVRHRSSGDV